MSPRSPSQKVPDANPGKFNKIDINKKGNILYLAGNGFVSISEISTANSISSVVSQESKS